MIRLIYIINMQFDQICTLNIKYIILIFNFIFIEQNKFWTNIYTDISQERFENDDLCCILLCIVSWLHTN